MSTPSSHHFEHDGLTHRYLSWAAEAPGTPVLLLHGLRSYAHTWVPIAGALGTAGPLVAPDFRGRGDSSWDPARDYFTNRYVADVEALVAHLGWHRFVLLGHSMGGAVGYCYAARHPDQVAALVIEDIGPASSTTTAGAERIIGEISRTPADFESLDAVRSYWRAVRPDITDEALASRIEYTVHESGDGRWRWKLDMAGIAAARLSGDPAGPVDLWACVESLRCPTLVVRGAHSDFLPTPMCAEMARRQPLLRWAEVPRAGHYVHDDNPGEFCRLVCDFLAAPSAGA